MRFNHDCAVYIGGQYELNNFTFTCVLPMKKKTLSVSSPFDCVVFITIYYNDIICFHIIIISYRYSRFQIIIFSYRYLYFMSQNQSQLQHITVSSSWIPCIAYDFFRRHGLTVFFILMSIDQVTIDKDYYCAIGSTRLICYSII